ncbi:hypothetical protein [Flavobacterium channae]|uniref:hypothetical protein n=1 Tax=Flavobacterium channae TaxID=2897181 RepID=UPI001E51B903|nr:hypothetical protein [Flavobacterium channae]UGS24596.1 hypothetical protein LOS89_04805 [Flavobacterium channae]
MKKLLLLLILSPLFMAFQCETENECFADITKKEKPNLITIENLQTSYNVGDIIWFNSTLERIQNFENQTETIDLFSFPLDYGFGIQFYKSSIYNPEIFLCLNNTTTEITYGSLNQTLGCNLFVYEKIGNELKCRIGVKLLEPGNYKLSIYNISTFRETGLNCGDKGLDINTTFSNNNQQEINFTVQ